MIKEKILRTKNKKIIQRECYLPLKDGFIVLITTKIREFIPIPGKIEKGAKVNEQHEN